MPRNRLHEALAAKKAKAIELKKRAGEMMAEGAYADAAKTYAVARDLDPDDLDLPVLAEDAVIYSQKLALKEQGEHEAEVGEGGGEREERRAGMAQSGGALRVLDACACSAWPLTACKRVEEIQPMEARSRDEDETDEAHRHADQGGLERLARQRGQVGGHLREDVEHRRRLHRLAEEADEKVERNDDGERGEESPPLSTLCGLLLAWPPHPVREE